MARERVERRLAAILAADVAGYSRLMGANEEGTLARVNAHRREFLDPRIAEVKCVKRCKLVEAQAAYCATPKTGKIVPVSTVSPAGSIFLAVLILIFRGGFSFSGFLFFFFRRARRA